MFQSYCPTTLPEGFAFKIRNEDNRGYAYSCLYELAHYTDDSKHLQITAKDLKPAFSGIPHPAPAYYYDKQWLNNILTVRYKNDDESQCSLLKKIRTLEALIKDKFSTEYFTNIISSRLKYNTFGTPMYEKDPNYWFLKCNFRPFETKEWISLVESGVFNNIKVKIVKLENKVELNGKEGVIKGYKDKRFIVKIEGKKYLLKDYNIVYNENYLMGEKKTIFGRYIRKVTRNGYTYPTIIRFRLSTPRDSWNTIYKNTCTGEIIERDNDVLRQMLRDYKFKIKFTPRIHYKLTEDFRMFLSVELLLLELNFFEKKPDKSLEYIFFDTDDEEEDQQREAEDEEKDEED